MAPQTNKTTQKKYILFGKFFTLLFACLLTATSIVMFKQNQLIKDRDTLLQNTLNLLAEESALIESINLYIQQNIVNFDRINYQLKNIQTYLKTIENKRIETEDIENAFSQLKKNELVQRQLIEDIKSTFAVIQNSNRYLPVLINECRNTLKDNESRDLLEKLFIASLVLKSSWSMDARLNFLEAQKKLNKALPEQHCKNLIAHSNILQNYYGKQYSLIKEIMNTPVKKNILTLYAQYESETTKLIERNKIYNGLLLIVSFIFLGLVSASLYLLFNTNKSLTNAYSDLEIQKSLYQALSEANQVVYNLNTKQEIFDAITRIATTYMKVPSCWIGRQAKNSDIIEMISVSGIGKEAIKSAKISVDPNKPKGQGAVSRAYRNKQSVIINNYAESKLAKPWVETTQKWGLKALAAFPILLHNKIEGVITFYSLEEDFFTDDIVQLIQELIDDVGIALQRLTLQERQEQLLKEQSLSAIAFESQEAIIITNARGKIIKVNQAFTNMTGYSQNETFGKTPRILKSNLHQSTFYKKLWKSITTTGTWQSEMWNRKKDGTLFPVYQTITAVYDENGKITHYVSHAKDLTSSKEAEMEISYLRTHDNLTDLPNRNFLLKKIEQFLIEDNPSNQPFNMILVTINIKRFKTYNETLGHLAGDAILIETAERLKAAKFKFAKVITPSRIGADEFSLLCKLKEAEKTKPQQISQQITHDIIESLSEPYKIENQIINIECTLGVTFFQSHSHETPENIIQQANIALHRAKLNPKLNLEFYQEEMQQQAILLRNLELDLSHALKNEEFILHYQPQMDLKTGAIVGAEALIRWQKDNGSIVPPGEFIPVLESSNLIIPTGQWLLRKALSDMHKIQDFLKHRLVLAINLSAVQFRDPNLITVIEDSLTETNYPPELLELEVTESVLMDDPKDVTDILEKVAKLKVKIAIDDFGTGYSSFAYLKHFPVNKLKIDKSFVDDIEKPKDYAIARSIIEMAKAMNIKSIAEGLETSSQRKLLKKLECDEAQGFLCSHPLPFEEFVDFVAKNHAKHLPVN